MRTLHQDVALAGSKLAGGIKQVEDALGNVEPEAFTGVIAGLQALLHFKPSSLPPNRDMGIEEQAFKEATKAIKHVFEELKDTAVQELRNVAERLADSARADSAVEEFKQAGGADLLTALGSMFGDFMQARRAVREHYRVREVAALVLCCLSASPQVSWSLKEVINGALVRRRVLETDKDVLRALNLSEDMCQQIDACLFSTMTGGNDAADQLEADRLAWAAQEDQVPFSRRSHSLSMLTPKYAALANYMRGGKRESGELFLSAICKTRM